MGKALTIHFINSEKTIIVSDCDIQDLDGLKFTSEWVIKSKSPVKEPDLLINMRHVAWVELSQSAGKG